MNKASVIPWISRERGERAIEGKEPGWRRLWACSTTSDHAPLGEEHFHLAPPGGELPDWRQTFYDAEPRNNYQRIAHGTLAGATEHAKLQEDPCEWCEVADALNEKSPDDHGTLLSYTKSACRCDWCRQAGVIYYQANKNL